MVLKNVFNTLIGEKVGKDKNDYCKGNGSFSNAIDTCNQLNMDLVGDHSQLTSLAKSNNVSEVWLPLVRNRTTDSGIFILFALK